ncbi:MAG TPA: cation:proton antiporter [Acetobacteraceae bacterium]|nr:cation:proton antiporter [Acetobacteraceae bacterium]
MLESLVALFGATIITLPITRLLGLGSILGYLIAGILIGPACFGFVQAGGQISGISELGVVMLLFLIGLELRPHRLWVLRSTILSLGFGQMIPASALIALLAHLAGIAWPGAIVLGGGLALSSTAIVLPMLGERKLLATTSGRDAFAVLLFQDVIAIIMVALVPLLAPGAVPAGAAQHLLTTAIIPWQAVARGLGVILLLLGGGIFLVPRVFRAVSRLDSPEIFTAATLLLVVGAAALADWAGLSMSLGAFMAGVMLSDSEYRHAVQANIEPFEGLLLGFFFISIGMSMDIHMAVVEPLRVAAWVAALLAVKIGVGFLLGWSKRRNLKSALRFSLALPEASEFSFVLFGVAAGLDILDPHAASFATLVVALSMIATPLIFAGSERYVAPRLDTKKPIRKADKIVASDAPVIICGFGRMGQIVGRLLRVQRIAYTALDRDTKVIDTVRRFGVKVYYGDPTRVELLRAAGAGQAKLIVIALAEREEALKLAEMVKREFPHLTILARAHDRAHAQALMDLGITQIVRETYFSALRLSELVLNGLDFGAEESRRVVSLFRAHDEALLLETHSYAADEKRVLQTMEQATAELADLLESDRVTAAQAS